MITNSLFAPTPFASYPFFNRSFSISNLATCNFNLSVSESDLLVCKAANEFPLCSFGSNAFSPNSL